MSVWSCVTAALRFVVDVTWKRSKAARMAASSAVCRMAAPPEVQVFESPAADSNRVLVVRLGAGGALTSRQDAGRADQIGRPQR
jgi:hypothetical protein